MLVRFAWDPASRVPAFAKGVPAGIEADRPPELERRYVSLRMTANMSVIAKINAISCVI